MFVVIAIACRKMKKVLIFLLLVLANPIQAQEKIKTALFDWCPYVCINQGAKLGYAFEISRLIFAEQGIKIDVKASSYSEAIEQLKTGEIDFLPIIKASDIRSSILSSSTIGLTEDQFFTIKGNDWYYTNPVSLERLDKLGLISGVNYDPVIFLHQRKNRQNILMIEEKEGVKGLLQRLLDGSVTAIIADGSAVNFHKKMMPDTQDITLVGSMRNKQELMTAFSKKYGKATELARSHTAALITLRKSGKLASILEKYNIEDWN